MQGWCFGFKSAVFRCQISSQCKMQSRKLTPTILIMHYLWCFSTILFNIHDAGTFIIHNMFVLCSMFMMMIEIGGAACEILSERMRSYLEFGYSQLISCTTTIFCFVQLSRKLKQAGSWDARLTEIWFVCKNGEKIGCEEQWRSFTEIQRLGADADIFHFIQK